MIYWFVCLLMYNIVYLFQSDCGSLYCTQSGWSCYSKVAPPLDGTYCAPRHVRLLHCFDRPFVSKLAGQFISLITTKPGILILHQCLTHKTMGIYVFLMSHVINILLLSLFGLFERILYLVKSVRRSVCIEGLDQDSPIKTSCSTEAKSPPPLYSGA